MSMPKAHKARNAQIARIVRLALEEDIGHGDVTSVLFSDKERAVGQFLAKQDGILSGSAAAKAVFLQISPSSRVRFLKRDGDNFNVGDILGEVSAPVTCLLQGERTALNFLQRLSGIATLTAKYVSALGNRSKAAIYDTRKTSPLLRLLEKEAVVHGGGRNHRFGLFDMALLKNNHIDAGGGVTEAVKKLDQCGFFQKRPRLKLCIECRAIDEAIAATAVGADIVMLDNMTLGQLRHCARLIDEESKRLGIPRPQIEISGGITRDKLPALGRLPIDRISVGAITHSAPATDISFRIGHKRA